jgi:hypothetical protein
VERVSQLRIDAVYNSRHATYDLRLFCTFCGSRSGPSGLLPLAGEGGGRKEVLSGARPRPSVPPERVPRASIRATLRRGGTWSSIRKREEPSNHPRMDANGRILPSKRSGAPTKGAGDADLCRAPRSHEAFRARAAP